MQACGGSVEAQGAVPVSRELRGTLTGGDPTSQASNPGKLGATGAAAGFSRKPVQCVRPRGRGEELTSSVRCEVMVLACKQRFSQNPIFGKRPANVYGYMNTEGPGGVGTLSRAKNIALLLPQVTDREGALSFPNSCLLSPPPAPGEGSFSFKSLSGTYPGIPRCVCVEKHG